MEKAGFFRRFLAVFIDGILLAPLSYFLVSSVGNQYVGFPLQVLYEAVLIAMWNGQTVGKKVMGVRITTTSGGSVDFVKALIRPIAKILSAIVLALGYLWMLWDKNSQTWHDKIAGTYAVKV
jgi:uncharacterized RDD family membrane protein YckC